MLCHIVAAGTIAFRLQSRIAACVYLKPAVCRCQRSAQGLENISYSNRAGRGWPPPSDVKGRTSQTLGISFQQF